MGQEKYDVWTAKCDTLTHLIMNNILAAVSGIGDRKRIMDDSSFASGLLDTLKRKCQG